MSTYERIMSEADVREEYGGEADVGLGAAREGRLFSVKVEQHSALWDVRESDTELWFNYRERALMAVIRHFYGEAREVAVCNSTRWSVRRVVLS